ncbi:MAG: hypothetical protein N4A61_12245 [Pelagimonas sp.]|jgi:hypothetical protein|nr:hypothetical protein [Pelagimonas sp.]
MKPLLLALSLTFAASTAMAGPGFGVPDLDFPSPIQTPDSETTTRDCTWVLFCS